MFLIFKWWICVFFCKLCRLLCSMQIWVMEVSVLALTLTAFDDVCICVQPDFSTTWSWKHEGFGCVCGNLFIDFYFEFFKFFFDLVIQMSDVLEEVFVIIFLLFFWIVDVLPVGSDVIDCALNHACMGHILRERCPSVYIALSGHDGAVKVVLLCMRALLCVADSFPFEISLCVIYQIGVVELDVHELVERIGVVLVVLEPCSCWLFSTLEPFLLLSSLKLVVLLLSLELCFLIDQARSCCVLFLVSIGHCLIIYVDTLYFDARPSSTWVDFSLILQFITRGDLCSHHFCVFLPILGTRCFLLQVCWKHVLCHLWPLAWPRVWLCLQHIFGILMLWSLFDE